MQTCTATMEISVEIPQMSRITLSYKSTIQLLGIIQRILAIFTRLHNQKRREGVESQNGQFQEKRRFQHMAGQLQKLPHSTCEFIKSNKTKSQQRWRRCSWSASPRWKAMDYWWILGREKYFSLEIWPLGGSPFTSTWPYTMYALAALRECCEFKTKHMKLEGKKWEVG